MRGLRMGYLSFFIHYSRITSRSALSFGRPRLWRLSAASVYSHINSIFAKLRKKPNRAKKNGNKSRQKTYLCLFLNYNWIKVLSWWTSCNLLPLFGRWFPNGVILAVVEPAWLGCDESATFKTFFLGHADGDFGVCFCCLPANILAFFVILLLQKFTNRVDKVVVATWFLVITRFCMISIW